MITVVRSWDFAMTSQASWNVKWNKTKKGNKEELKKSDITQNQFTLVFVEDASYQKRAHCHFCAWLNSKSRHIFRWMSWLLRRRWRWPICAFESDVMEYSLLPAFIVIRWTKWIPKLIFRIGILCGVDLFSLTFEEMNDEHISYFAPF